jgi:hypothetical protein
VQEASTRPVRKNSVYVSRLNFPHHLRRLKVSTRTKTMPRGERAGFRDRVWERELPCDPGAAEKLTAEVFGHGRADDLAHWRSDASAAVAIERGGMLTAFAYRRGSGSGRRRDATRRRSSRRWRRPQTRAAGET